MKTHPDVDTTLLRMQISKHNMSKTETVINNL